MNRRSLIIDRRSLIIGGLAPLVLPARAQFFSPPMFMPKPAGGAFSPRSLFMGDTGGWWDGTNTAHMWQDVAGTVPVTMAGDPVARIDDQSGNGNNLLSVSPTSQPLFNSGGGVNFDGVNDYLQGTFTLAQPFTRVTTATNLNAAQTAFMWDGALTSLYMEYFSGFGAYMNAAVGPIAATGTFCSTEQWNGASSQVAQDNGSYATGNPGSATPGGFTVANTASLAGAFNLRFFGSINIGRILTVPEIAQCRTFFGALAGLVL